MTKYLVFLVLLSMALGLSTTMNNALRNQVVIDFKNAIIPIVTKNLQNIRLPNIEGKKGIIKYWVYDIVVNVNPVNPAQIGIQFLAPSSLRVSGSALAMSGKATARGKVLFIRKTVDVSISVHKANFDISISLVPVNNKPNIRINHFDLGISHRDVGIKIRGGFIGAIINLVVNLLKGHIVKQVGKAINNAVPPLVTSKINTILNGLRSEIKINNQISMKYQFPTAPSVKNGFLLTGIVAYLHPTNDPTPPPGPVNPIPEIDNKYDRGIQFFVSDYIVQSALVTLHKLQKMTVRVNKKIANRDVSMLCTVTDVPQFKFMGTIQATGHGSCSVSLDNDPKPKFRVIATLQMELSEKVKGAILFFNAKTLTLSQLEFKVLQPVDITWFKNAINDVVKAILTVVNGELGQRGIPLPVVKEVDYTDIVQYIGNGYLMVGTTPKFHITMDEEEKMVFEEPTETVVVTEEVMREYMPTGEINTEETQ